MRNPAERIAVAALLAAFTGTAAAADDPAGAVSPSSLKESGELPAVQNDQLPAATTDKLPAVQKEKLPAVQKQTPPAVRDEAAGELRERGATRKPNERAAPGLGGREAPKLRPSLPEGERRKPISRELREHQPGIEPAGIGDRAPGGRTGGFAAPDSVTSPGHAATGRPAGDIDRESLERAEWRGDVEIVDVRLDGPIDPGLQLRGSPPPAVFGREYGGVIRVENNGSRAVRVQPMYEHAGELTGTGARVGGVARDDDVNLPVGEVVEIPVVFDFATMSASARTETAASERFSATLFLAHPRGVGTTVEQRMLRDVNMSNHRVDIEIPVIETYRVTADLAGVDVRHDCRDASERDLNMQWYLGARSSDSAGSTRKDTVTLSNPARGRTLRPASRLAIPRVLSHQELELVVGVMHTRGDDGSVRGVAEGSLTMGPLDWRDEGTRTIQVDTRDVYDGCDPAGTSGPLVLDIELEVARN